MTQLTVYPDTDPSATLIETRDAGAIAKALADIGVVFERWEASVQLSEDAGQEAVLAAYDAQVKKLMREGGYQTVDVVRVKPDHPDRVAMRQKFFAEHTHNEDEVRFFVEGAGAFYLRKDGRVFRVVCERNDLLSVPAGITHWFDTGAAPHFCAIRIFTSKDGWVGNFTGDDIATRFPAFGDQPMAVRAILTDIEGTTTPIAFVHEALFPYARARMAEFCKRHAGEPRIAAVLREARELDGHRDLDLDATVALLIRWIDEDRKAGPLKTLQGIIWRKGYEEGVLKGQVYEDTARLLTRWHAQGLALFVYSSGSEEAQKLIFGYSDKGDLAALFSGFYDTRVGAKVEPGSYVAIAKAAGFAPSDMLFLSDHAGEVQAAKAAGLQVARIDRALAPDASTREDGVLVAGSFGPVDRAFGLAAAQA